MARRMSTTGSPIPSSAVFRPPTHFDIDTEPERLAKVGDLWAEILASKQDLRALIESH